ncbi:MAG: primosomal protein N' [Clostridia bacterium]|nr:primosomal protein N' [Clostridia bacterium]
MKLAGVAVENAAFSFDKAFDYIIPAESEQKAVPGVRVTVPFGKGSKKRLGIILTVFEGENRKGLKKIGSVLDEEPLLNAEMIKMVFWLKDRTFCTLYEAAKAVLPTGINHRMVVSYTVSGNKEASQSLTPAEEEIYNYIASKSGYVRRDAVLKALGLSSDCKTPDDLVKKGALFCNMDAVRNIGDASVRMLTLNDEIPDGVRITQKQQSVVDFLNDVGCASVKEICYFTGVTPAVPTALVKSGAARWVEFEVLRTPKHSQTETDTGEIKLSDVQQKAFDSIEQLMSTGKPEVCLLYGVTGSGKTLVYLKAIDKAVADGKSVIVMVPEIALTPQTMERFSRRYGKKVAVFHSALSAGEKLDEWKRAKRGEATIIVGTRSAVFAPVENIGLVIIDEEQEHTYKSEQSPRYSAKEVAKFRVSENNCLLLLASATPSVESYANAQSGRYSLQTLSTRYGDAQLPDVITVDMLHEPRAEGSNTISQKLLDELKQNLGNSMQSILLINRRGFNTFVACNSCGHVITCPYCSISMTYHSANKRLMCHYCGYSEDLRTECPECGEKSVRYSGFGTQKIEDELSNLLPDAKILRMDTDTTTGKDSHERMLKKFADREYDIMVGTQMVAKGLDFSNVTLVGVISVDQQLYNDDFRSLEKTFSLLTQVVGRSGRGENKGRAIIQTITPENSIIQLAAKQDYEEFFKTEIRIRKALIYPPYCDICVLAFTGENEIKVKAASQQALGMVMDYTNGEYKNEKVICLGPRPARVSKISNKYRYRLIIKCHGSRRFREMISKILIDLGSKSELSSVTVTADINPESII